MLTKLLNKLFPHDCNNWLRTRSKTYHTDVHGTSLIFIEKQCVFCGTIYKKNVCSYHNLVYDKKLKRLVCSYCGHMIPAYSEISI
jgi:hypothetical protein